jgi:hypothetical protein
MDLAFKIGVAQARNSRLQERHVECYPEPLKLTNKLLRNLF